MKLALLDTVILSAFLKGDTKIVSKAETYLKESKAISFSIISYYEVLNGLLYKDARNQLSKFIQFTELNKVLPLTISATQIAAEISATLRRKGQPIGHTDCLIAGIALSNKMQLVTNNTAHFSRIQELEVVNWFE